jgi:lipid A oxidase
MTLRPHFRVVALSAFAACLGTAALAEVELSVYGGYQTSPHSEVSVFGDAVVPDSDFVAGWEGRPFSAPPYYGFRATWWASESLGFGLDMNHAKVYADDETLAETGYERLEFSDGLNIITLNAYRSWEDGFGIVSPYVGGGLGVSFPHVELTDGGSETFGYQLTGPAVAWIAGASLPINDSWSVFGEYKGTYSINSADLDGGGTLETNIITNAVNVGVSFNF